MITTLQKMKLIVHLRTALFDWEVARFLQNYVRLTRRCVVVTDLSGFVSELRNFLLLGFKRRVREGRYAPTTGSIRRMESAEAQGAHGEPKMVLWVNKSYPRISLGFASSWPDVLHTRGVLLFTPGLVWRSLERCASMEYTASWSKSQSKFKSFYDFSSCYFTCFGLGHCHYWLCYWSLLFYDGTGPKGLRVFTVRILSLTFETPRKIHLIFVL